MTQTRRKLLATIGSLGVVGTTGCLAFDAERVSGFEATGPNSYDVSLGENQYAVETFQAQRQFVFRASFVVSTGEMALLLLDRDQFSAYEDGDRFEGYWEVTDTTIDESVIGNRFFSGDEFVLVADNTGVIEEHTISGRVNARVRVDP